MDEEAVAFTELGLLPQYMSLSGPNRVFFNVHADGLGWAIPAALGAQLADRNRLVISMVGDGSYMFTNPTACHQIAKALELPILIIIKNNGMWNAVRRSVVKAYPDGTAAQSNTMPLTSLEPAPNFSMIAQASRAHAEQVLNPQDLPSALQRALRVIREEKRQVLLDLRVQYRINIDELVQYRLLGAGVLFWWRVEGCHWGRSSDHRHSHHFALV